MKTSIHDNLCLNILKGVLDQRYMTNIREKEGGTYGVGVQSGSSKEPYESYSMSMSFDCDPDKAEHLKSLIYAEIDKLMKEGPTQEEIDNLQPPSDGTQRNFEGLLENLRSYKIPPSEQYAIILKSNFGAIGNPVWKGFSNIRGSNGKIKLPGHYLLSVIN